MIVVTGHFRLAPEAVEQARPYMAHVVTQSRAEPGCLGYHYGEDLIEPGLFRITEAWESREDLARHLGEPHMKAWQGARGLRLCRPHSVHSRGFADRTALTLRPPLPMTSGTTQPVGRRGVSASRHRAGATARG